MSTDQKRHSAKTPTSKRDAARRRIAEKRAAEAAARAREERRRRTLIGGIAAAVVVIVAIVVVIIVQNSRTSTSANAATPAHTVDNGLVIPVGQASAPVTLDVYEDFQCPICKQFQDANGSALDQMVAQGTVKVRYHLMAFLDTAANKQYSTRAANAAAAVTNAGGDAAFAKLHDILYAHQPPESGSGLSDDQLIQFAAQAGAGGDQVAKQIRDLTYEDWTKKATDRASKDGVTGTPTVHVNGKDLAVQDLVTPGGLAKAVDAATPKNQ